MKRLIPLITFMLIAIGAMADVATIYLNPIQNKGGATKIALNRLVMQTLLGMSRAKTVAITTGTERIQPGTPAAEKYDYLMNMVLTDATVEKVLSITEALGGKDKNPTWEGKMITDITLVSASTGNEVFNTTLVASATDKNRDIVLFKAPADFNLKVTDMTDDAFRVSGELGEPIKVDKKNIVQKVKAKIGSEQGVRKDQTFEIYKVSGDTYEFIGMAMCDQVAGPNESILSVKGKKDHQKILSDMIQNQDGTYMLVVRSCSGEKNIVDNWITDRRKLKFKKPRLNYMTPSVEGVKPQVAFMGLDIIDNNISNAKETFHTAAVEGLVSTPTVVPVKMIYTNGDDARRDNIDGLIGISVDKVEHETERDSEGKTIFNSKIYLTVAGYDVTHNRYVDMKTYTYYGDSDENYNKADANAFHLVADALSKFIEDVFPISASIISAEKVNKDKVETVRINKGTESGIKAGTRFDVYLQYAEGDDDVRIRIGDGKVVKEGLSANEAIVDIGGKSEDKVNCNKRLYELMQGMDDNAKITLISKAYRTILDK